MSTFFAVLVFIVAFVAMLALVAWPLVVWMIFDDWGVLARIGNTVGALIVLAAVIAFGINSGMFSTDDAAHCGPGTRYVSESHYNPATKTTITNWMCTV